MKVLFCISSFLICMSSWSYSLDAFNKRFEFVKNDQGELQFIRDRSITGSFSIAPYLKFIKKGLLEEQERLNSKSDYEGQIRNLFANEKSYDEKGGVNHLEVIIDSLKELRNIDIEAVFSNPKFNGVIKRFESRLGDALLKLDPTVMANVADSTFFHRKRATYQVVSWGLNYAKSKLSQIPLLNTAAHVLVTVEKMVRERREFHQNMLLHYLENYTAEELGITHDEANLVFSSIYESKIAWYAFWESQDAVLNWANFGTTRFFQGIRAANGRFRNLESQYQSIGDRVNFAFQKVSLDGEDLLINLYDGANLFDQNPAVAYNFSDTTKVARRRLVLQLAELGLSFLPLPNFLKGTAESYMKSFYESQKITEGALYAFFESQEMDRERTIIKLQYMNPFDLLSL